MANKSESNESKTSQSAVKYTSEEVSTAIALASIMADQTVDKNCEPIRGEATTCQPKAETQLVAMTEPSAGMYYPYNPYANYYPTDAYGYYGYPSGYQYPYFPCAPMPPKYQSMPSCRPPVSHCPYCLGPSVAMANTSNAVHPLPPPMPYSMSKRMPKPSVNSVLGRTARMPMEYSGAKMYSQNGESALIADKSLHTGGQSGPKTTIIEMVTEDMLTN